MTMTTQQGREAAIEALVMWNQGNQQEAVDRVRPYADEGDRVALGVISWFLYQMGEPRWKEGIPYALKAAKSGLPWVLSYYLGNILNDPNYRSQAPELMQLAVNSGWAIDPIAHAMQPLQQGDRGTALALLEVAASSPEKEQWSELVASARVDAEKVEQAAKDADERRTQVLEALGNYESEVAADRDRIGTQINQLATLIEQATNAEAQTLFKEEAARNVKQGRTLWSVGFAVLIVAAILSATPMFLHYFGEASHELDGAALTTSHLAPTIALGAVSGILLSRARGRDRAGQRAGALSVALGTMFVYSGQIVDEAERQRFLHDMGRVVIESYLRQDTPPGDDGTSLLAALLRRA